MQQDDSHIDLDSLMEIATSSNEPIKKDNPEVLKFISEFGLESGDTRVPACTIYYKYYCWKREKGQRKKLSRNMFFRELSTHFKRKLIDKSIHYYLNPEPFDLTQEEYFAARALLRRERYVRQKDKEKRNKKK